MPKNTYPNIYWGSGLAPVDCQYRLVVPRLNREQFRQFLRSVRNEGIYYRHSWGERLVVLAFESKEMCDAHADMLQRQAELAEKYEAAE